MFERRNLILAAALLAGTGSALADTFTFDPTGTAGAAGNISGVGSFDQKPGNALAIGAGGTLTFNQTFTLLYQANLNTALDNTSQSNTVFSQGQNLGGANRYFTFVAGFGERVTSGGGPTAGFSLDTSNPVNFFRVYANTVGGGDNLSGLGFTTGTVILSGTIINSGFSSSFNQTLNSSGGPTFSNFDGFGSDDYSGKQSVTGGGGTNLTAQINFINANYFPDLTLGSSLVFFSTTQAVPFNQVDPSRAFIDATGSVSGATATNLCTINGAATSAGCTSANNFQLQADGSNTFTRAVPEPDSVLLLGLGLGLIGLITKRRKSVA